MIAYYKAVIADMAAEYLLTPREQTVFELMTKNLSFKDIGSMLVITERTVNNVAKTIYEKLGVGKQEGGNGRISVMGMVMEQLLMKSNGGTESFAYYCGNCNIDFTISMQLQDQSLIVCPECQDSHSIEDRGTADVVIVKEPDAAA